MVSGDHFCPLRQDVTALIQRHSASNDDQLPTRRQSLRCLLHNARRVLGFEGTIAIKIYAHQFAIDRVRTAVQDLGASATQLADSPILGGGEGGKGNREFLLYARF